MAVKRKDEGIGQAGEALKEAIYLMHKLRDLGIVKNNNSWYAKLGNVENEMRSSLGTILVKAEMEKMK